MCSADSTIRPHPPCLHSVVLHHAAEHVLADHGTDAGIQPQLGAVNGAVKGVAAGGVLHAADADRVPFHKIFWSQV